MKRQTAFLAGALLTAASLAACGGGSGSGSPAAAPTPAPTTTPTAAPAGGFVPAAGPITVLPAAGGSFGSTLLPGSSDGDFIVQAASQPGGLNAAGAIGQYQIGASETAGLSSSSLARGAVRPRTAYDVADEHAAAAADRLREIPPSAFGVERIVESLPRAQSATRATAATRVTKANLGDQRTFKVLYSGIGGTSTQCPNPNVGSYTCYVNVTATLQAIGVHSYVWVDNVSLSNPNEFPSTSYFTATASNFDQYYAAETQAFGPAFSPVNVGQNVYNQCDSSGNTLPTSQWVPEPDMTGTDPHISILITDALSGTGEGGYFYAGNEFAQQVLNCGPAPHAVSNELPMVVIGSDNYTTGPNLPQYNPTYWLQTDMPRSMSHELQHLLHSIDKYYARLAQNLPYAVDDAWIDEGCSMLAEDIAANGIAIDTPRYSYGYVLEPSQFSLTSFVGYQPNPITGTGPYGFYFYTSGNYGMAYLFLRYVYDRFGGSTALHAIYADFRSGTAGQSNVNPVLAAAGNESWQQLFGEWAIAVAAQSSGITSDPRYGFSPAIVLRGTVQIPSRRSPPLNVRTLVFGGPQPPEAFDASGNVTGYVSLGAGAAPAVRALDGAANYFLPAAVSAGATVRAQTGSLPSPQGAMVQGNLPTPQPTSF